MLVTNQLVTIVEALILTLQVNTTSSINNEIILLERSLGPLFFLFYFALKMGMKNVKIIEDKIYGGSHVV